MAYAGLDTRYRPAWREDRQAGNAKLTRGEALRQAVIELLDNKKSFVDESGKAVFACAHPPFWAPCTIIGGGL